MKIYKRYNALSRKDADGVIWSQYLYDMSFVSERIGWIIGSGQVLATEDGGETWSNYFHPDKKIPYSHSHTIFCSNKNEVWIPSFTKHECCYTRDNGKTWDTKLFKDGVFPVCILFRSEFGCIVGDNRSYKRNVGEIHITSDSGRTWGVYELALNGNARKVRFADNSNGWFLENSLSKNEEIMESSLHNSTDGGRTWKEIASLNLQVLDFEIISDKSLIMVGEEGFISLSNDIGKSWNIVDSPKTLGINCVTFSNKQIGVAGCDSGVILVTKDGGNSWSFIEKETSENFVSVVFVSSKHGFLLSNLAVYSFELD